MLTKPPLADNPTRSRLSPIRETFKSVKDNPAIANLCIGDPYVPPPAVVSAAFKQAIDQGFTHYENDAGSPRLRELVALTESTARGADFHPYRNIVITNGGTNGIYSFSRAILDPGDEVLLPEPIWIPFTEITKLLGCHPVYVPTRPDNHFMPQISDLESRVTDRTKAVVVVSPGNPTGAVYDRQTLEAVHAFCVKHNLWLLHDEAYKDIIFDDRGAHSLVGHSDNVVGVRTLSKSHAMTGFRVGWILSSNRDLIDRVRLNVAYNVMCVSTPAQVAACVALDQAADYLSEVVHEYRDRVASATSSLRDLGFHIEQPSGAFYVFPQHRYPSDLAERLVDEAAVAVVNGERFGPSGHDHFRISCSVSREALDLGIDRLARWCQQNPL